MQIKLCQPHLVTNDVNLRSKDIKSSCPPLLFLVNSPFPGENLSLSLLIYLDIGVKKRPQKRVEGHKKAGHRYYYKVILEAIH